MEFAFPGDVRPRRSSPVHRLGLLCGWGAPQLNSELPYGRVSQSCGAAAVGVAECSISRAAVAPAVLVRVLSVRLAPLAFVFRSCSCVTSVAAFRVRPCVCPALLIAAYRLRPSRPLSRHE